MSFRLYVYHRRQIANLLSGIYGPSVVARALQPLFPSLSLLSTRVNWYIGW